MSKRTEKFFKGFYTNLFIIGTIVSLVATLLLYATPFAGIAFVALGLCLSPIITGASKPMDNKFTIKVYQSEKIKEIKHKHKVLQNRELWVSGYKSNSVRKFLEKHDKHTLKVK